MRTIRGLHHLTAIAGPAQENLDFYTGVLGFRLVKRSVNQDHPSTYHLFYADAEGHPGTDLTFFSWAQKAPALKGVGLGVELALDVPPGSLEFWIERLEAFGGRARMVETRFGERTLPFIDPHGLEVALVETEESLRRPFTPWEGSPIPLDCQIRGLHSARLWEQKLDPSASFLTSVLGFTHLGTEGPWHRFSVDGGGSGRCIDLQELPYAHRGFWGVGGIHHMAWRVEDERHQLDVRADVSRAGRRPTPVIDRFWFKSVYFREPGGVLFELATDGPGFGADEDLEQLGQNLVLPPWLEGSRGQIEGALPALEYPSPVLSRTESAEASSYRSPAGRLPR